MRFADRWTAGQRLAGELEAYRNQRPIVLALPRGGVVTGAAVAQELGAPLDVVVARRIGVPLDPELAMGAIAEGGALYVNRDVFDELDLDATDIERAALAQMHVVEQRSRLYRGDRGFPEVRDRTVILVDDGLATGSTARAAVRAIRAHHPRLLVLAVPVGAPGSVAAMSSEVDDLVCLNTPPQFFAVGAEYESFPPVEDQQVIQILSSARERIAGLGIVRIELHDVVLEGTLTVPENARGIVLFAHGSGSSRHSPRNRFVAAQLQAAGLGTLLFDLLSAEEEAIDHIQASYRFDVGLLARRLIAATEWLEESEHRGLRVGYFGSSTGAAAALIAASLRPGAIGAIISRGGRPDLDDGALPRVDAPTLLIVGEADELVVQMNRDALEQMACERKLVLVPGATHLFEEPGALEQVAQLAAKWFRQHLGSRPAEEARA